MNTTAQATCGHANHLNGFCAVTGCGNYFGTKTPVQLGTAAHLQPGYTVAPRFTVGRAAALAAGRRYS